MALARCVMVLGTTSGAGKSWLATALCRWYARQGHRVAPFKAQNMSNNARVVPGPGGALGEIGSAQYFQALAARAEPDVRMNPVLLKPERDTGSQVVVLGRVRADLAAVPWRERSEALWPYARDALQALRADHDVVVIEGAGSPAEINLASSDYVNLKTAHASQAACLLVADIDRGGAFAHLYGTHRLMPAPERALLRGFVLNRFRGDATLLAPGPEQLEALTGVPTVAVLPMWRGHGLPEEDGIEWSERDAGPHDAPLDELDADDRPALRRIAIVACPRISNLDEFQPLRGLPGVRITWARTAGALDDCDLIVLPGSKSTASDLAWLRAQRLDAAIVRHAAQGRPVLGLCGGVQMLGESLADPLGVESSDVGEANSPGLGLLPLATVFERDKLLRRTHARFADALDGPWAALAGVAFDGYEIRCGRSVALPDAPAGVAVLRNPEGEPIGWQRGPVLGLSVHGVFESGAVLRALFGAGSRPLDGVFDGLADYVDRLFVEGVLKGLLARV